jgi:hypothetical protein
MHLSRLREKARRVLAVQRLVLNIDDQDLLDRLGSEAEKRGRPVEDLVLEALEWWAEAMEIAQDLADSDIALEEYELEGGIDAFKYFRERARDGDLQG